MKIEELNVAKCYMPYNSHILKAEKKITRARNKQEKRNKKKSF